ncbi:MAG TPA: restriction endonuclease subunit S [Acidobacteriaceae bacterium]|nr:restriction endonuclease subunit S [Acidobacteriaceae bacterium]
MSKEWQRQRFEACIEPVTYTRKILRKDFLAEGAYPVVSQEEDFINGYWDEEGDLFKVTTPIIVFGDHTKVLKYVDFDFVLGADGVKVLKPREFLSPKFLFYRLQAVELDSLGYARHYKLLKDLEIDYPAPSEQRRIVGILDEALEGIATAKTNAERNLQNARALFESHLQSVFAQRGAEWERVTLQALLKRGWIEDHMDGNHGGDYPRKEEFIRKGVPYISANCVDDERIDMSRAKYLSHKRASMLRKGFAKDNDVLFAHNATVGPVAILRTKEEKVILGKSLTYYRCDPKHLLPEYLAHYMRSYGFKTQYSQVMRQSTRNQVPITKQREFFHVIPPLEEQKRIIVALNGLFENTQRLESVYKQKLTALEELKKSLLHQAFNGVL